MSLYLPYTFITCVLQRYKHFSVQETFFRKINKMYLRLAQSHPWLCTGYLDMSSRLSRFGHFVSARLIGKCLSRFMTCYLADAFIQSDLQLIRLSRRHTPLVQCGVKGLAQGPNSCADLKVATPGTEPPTLRVQDK